MTTRPDPDLIPLPHQPGILVLYLTDLCNLECLHCSTQAGPGRSTQLPLTLVLRSLREVRSLGIGTIHLSGGEPFLYPQLAEVLTCAAAQEAALSVSTNGTLIGEREVALLRECGARAQVSIDGPQAYHDRFRACAGAFERAGKAIDRLVAARVPVTIVTTVCQDNQGSLVWLAGWAAEKGVEQLTVQPLLQLGRGAGLRSSKLTAQQTCRLMLQLSDLGHAYQGGLRFGLACRTVQFLRDHPCAAYVCNGTTCHRQVVKEIKKLIVRPDGAVLPESPSLDDQFALGHLHDGTLAELVQAYFADGYAAFDRLCRAAYEQILPLWTAPIIPWEEVISECSRMPEALLDSSEPSFHRLVDLLLPPE